MKRSTTPTAAMMTRNRRNHQRNDEYNDRSSSRWHHITDHEPRADGPRLGAYSVTGRGGSNNSANHAPFLADTNSPNYNPFHPGANNRQNPYNPFANPRPPYSSSRRFHDSQNPPNYSQKHFRIGSKLFKEYLLNSINQTLQQIQQWYPDHDEETVGNDGMDWQSEIELIIPQPTEKIHYIWDEKPLPKAPSMDEVDIMERSMKKETHATIPNRRRVASEGYIGVRKGVLVPNAWDASRREGPVSPRSVGPDMEVET